MEKQPSASAIIKNTFLALRYPNYRLWYFGQIISLLGTWMQSTAQGYLVYELTESKALLGMVSLAVGIPQWVLMLFAGVLAERVSRKRLIIFTQVWLMLLAFVLSVLTFLQIVAPWHIIVLAVCTGVGSAISTPARHAFVSDLVDDSAITNAISLNSTMFNIGTFIGPAIGGVVYAAVGPGWCFAINGISFIAVIIALLLMSILPKIQIEVDKKKHWFHDFAEGLRYVASHQRIRTIIIMTGIFSFFGFSIITMFPAWAKDVLRGDAATFGFLQSSRGFGALMSAVFLAFTAQFRIRGRLVTIGLFGIPVTMIVLSFVTIPLLAFGIIFVFGIMILFVFNSANAIVQSLVNDAFRGRVMSVYMMIFLGSHPLGALTSGILADTFGLEHTMFLYGGILAAAALFLLIAVPLVRKMR
ncbi:MAG: MFS transporter [Spirochaetales bacterium]|nr:MFS transporter [Spirochaetales bacterium]